MSTLPSDVIRIVEQHEFPPSVRELPSDPNLLKDGALMKHQRDWLKFIHANDLCIASKGRRTGITYATAKDDTITAASSREAGGDNVFYIGDTKDKGLEFIGYCAHMAKVMAMAMAHDWNGVEVFLFDDQTIDEVTQEVKSKKITSYRIRFASGFQIVALSSNPANIRGLQGIVDVDEAAFHQNVKGVLDASSALIIWGGKIRIISTHNGAQNPFNQLIRDAKKGLNDYKVFDVYFDDAVANGLYERVCMVKGWEPTLEGKAAWYKRVRGTYGTNKAAMLEELDGIPREGSGVAIPGILIEARMTSERPILRLECDDQFALQSEEYRKSWCDEWIRINVDPVIATLNKKSRYAYGSDYARHCDFAVFAPLEIQENLKRYCPFLVDMHKVPTRQQEQIIWYIIEKLPRFHKGAMDAGGNGATLAEYTADKFGHEIIEQIMLTNAWYRDNMGDFVDAFTDDTIDLPISDNVLNDIRALERIDGIVKLPALKQEDSDNSKLKRHGDSAIALALAYYASKQDVELFAYHSAAKHQQRNDDQRHRSIRTTGGFRRGCL
jgi:phage FluMu gp28-like protein